MTYSLFKIYPKSAGKLYGALMAMMLAVLSVPVSLVILFRNPLLGLLMLFLVPVLYGLFGYILGYLMALVFNLIARRVGGLQIELENIPQSVTVTNGSSSITRKNTL